MDGDLCSTALWSEETFPLKKFPPRNALPAVCQVRRGQYRGIGQEHQVIYIHSVETGQKVLAEGLKPNSLLPRKGRSLKFSFPVTYAGWFEVLSEDGKPIQPIQSVEELTKIAPQQCLVRDTFKAPFSCTETEGFSTEQVRQVLVGERLSLRGEVEAAFQGNRGGVAIKRYLRCVDDKGENIFLGLDLRAQFSPIAGPNNISGVHSLRGLLTKFRLPIVVRLVYGTIPARVERNFSPVFRFVGAYTDETAFVLPLPVRPETKMVTISTREPLLLAGAKNWEKLRDNDEFKECKERCTSSVKSYLNSIHILVDLPDPKAITRGKEWPRLEEIKSGEASNAESDEEERILFEEIEDIYRYVRGGGDPPPPRTRPTSVRQDNSGITISPNVQQDKKTTKNESVITMESQEMRVNLPESSTKTSHPAITQGVAVAHSDQPEDDGYWEEPIYEDIAKIRERKLTEKSAMVSENESSKIEEVESKTNPATKSEEVTKFISNPAMKIENSAITEEKTEVETKTETELKTETCQSGEMVENLRQIYLRQMPQSCSSSTRHVTAKRKPEIETKLETSTGLPDFPPVPPKSFDEITSGSGGLALDRSKLMEVCSTEADNLKPTGAASMLLSATNTTTKRGPRPKSQAPKVPPKAMAKNLKPTQNATNSVELVTPSTDVRSSGNMVNQKASSESAKQINLVKERNHLAEKQIKIPSAADSSANETVPLTLHVKKPLSTNQLTNRNSILATESGSPISFQTARTATPDISKADTVAVASKNNVSAVTKEPSKLVANSVSAKLPENSVKQNQLSKNLASTNQLPVNPVAEQQLPANSIATSQFTGNSGLPQFPASHVSTDQHPDPRVNHVSENPVPHQQLAGNSVSGSQLHVNPVSQPQPPENTVSATLLPGNFISPPNLLTTNSVLLKPETTNPFPQNQLSMNPSTLDRVSPEPLSHTISVTPQSDLVPVGLSESQSRPGITSTNSNRIIWSSSPGSTVQTDIDHGGPATTTVVNGVTTIHVSGSRQDSRLYQPGNPALYSSNPANTQIYVRLPNSSVGHALYRPQGSPSVFRVQSGTVYLTNSKGTDNDNWA